MEFQSYIGHTLSSIIFYFRCFIDKNIIITNRNKRVFRYNLFLKHATITITNKKFTGTFYNCKKLKYIHVVNTEYIPRGTFENCNNLLCVFIDKFTKEINEKAFQNCTHLKRVYIPKTINKIEACAFSNCINLKKIIFY